MVRAGSLIRALIDSGHAPRVAAHQHVVEIAQVLVDGQPRQERDALEHLGDLACGVLGRCALQPALAVLTVRSGAVQRR